MSELTSTEYEENSEELKTISSQNNGGGIVKILKFQGKVLFQKKKKLFRF